MLRKIARKKTALEMDNKRFCLMDINLVRKRRQVTCRQFWEIDLLEGSLQGGLTFAQTCKTDSDCLSRQGIMTMTSEFYVSSGRVL